ncbi:glycoside hydrolase family 78 protein [Agromyces mangrovi Wang et al. 2018]|nr:hypothetical protein GCM10025877_18450 [Agromyces mangrovi]
MSDPRTVRVDAGAPRGSDVVAFPRPRLGWATETDTPDWLQASAELELHRAGGIETATVAGRDSVGVDWPFASLAPRERAQLRVRTTGADGITGPWSEPREIRAGFLAEGSGTPRRSPMRTRRPTPNPRCCAPSSRSTAPWHPRPSTPPRSARTRSRSTATTSTTRC